jgi:poly-gamma-glutamate synthesis protein (capsule biosynthesis protein)
MLAVGDVTLEKPQGEFFLSKVAPVLRLGDVVVGNGEIAFTSGGIPMYVDMFPSPGCPPGNIGALSSAGFNVITLATNHIFDMGVPGIEDTIAGLRNYGIAAVGAGMNINEARKPAIIERNGTRFGFLNYNCVGPKGQWATTTKPGCAYVEIISHYEMTNNPGGPPDVYTFAERRSLKAMVDDVQKLRLLCDILVVAFHKGIRLSPKLAMYDQEVSHAAVDAGADLVLGHHTLMKGIEQYNGKTIFHGLGLFVPATKEVTVEQIKERHSFFDPNVSDVFSIQQYPSQYPARNLTMIAKCNIDDGKISQLSYLPCFINGQQQPEVLKNDERGRQVFDFMDRITREAGLNTQYEWGMDEIVIHADQI